MKVTSLIDRYGRVARDLRISVTDRCDLRCTYCMPEDGLDWLPPEQQLSFEEILKLTQVLVGLGITSVRLTGGEPLMRPHLAQLVSALSGLGLQDLSLTTNGTTLARHAQSLAEAGLNRVNISLDSLDAHRFAEITRRDVLGKVLHGISVAQQVGLQPVKVNCVMVAGTNDDEVLAFVQFARRTGCDVRFIENMPLGAGNTWSSEQVLSSAEILKRIDSAYPLVGLERGAEPAASYSFADASPGRVGVISSVSEPFCEQCDRLRLTSDGFLKTCLFAHTETDLRSPLRSGASESELAEIICSAVALKGPGHSIGQPEFEQPVRLMSRIGG